LLVGFSGAWKEPEGRLECPGETSRFQVEEALVINNTSIQRWDRITAKSLDAQFSQVMQQGLNCSPFEAQIMVEKVHELYGPLLDSSPSVQPGQILTVVVDASVPPGIPLAQAAQKRVTVTLFDPTEDVATQRTGGVPALRQKRLYRVCEEAFQQGGLFTLEDLSVLFNCGVRTLVGDLAALRQKKIIPPLRSTVQDIGRAITHRRLIVSLWLEGREYSDIAARTHHAVSSVSNYVEKFKRCVALLANGFDVSTTAFLVRLSAPLTEEFHQLHRSSKPALHRQRELDNFLKKSPLAQPPTAARRSR
jgi:hypothetical protein